MAILEEEVYITINNTKHFEELNYKIPKIKDKKGILRSVKGSKILVKVQDLKDGSKANVTKVCDECGEHVKNQMYKNIIRCRNRTDGKDRCEKCSLMYRGKVRKSNVSYNNTLECWAKINNKEYLLKEFSDKNFKNANEVSYGSGDEYLWNCPNNNQHEYLQRVAERTSRDRGCPYCSGHRVNETNCLATTHPHIVNLMYCPEDSYKYSSGSGQKIDFKCPNCKLKIKNKKIYSVVNQGLSCPQCSDGISYPEKFIFSVLTLLNIKFETQFVFNWLSNRKYDFYIPSLNIIIEVHGKQHFNGGFNTYGGRTLDEEVKNDKLKELTAKENGIKHYIVIDCSLSEQEFIRNSIIKSELIKLLNLNNIDWDNCHKNACGSLVKTCCNLWNKGKKITEISKVLKISDVTVRRYLKQGVKIGWCEYDPLKSRSKLTSEQVVEIKKLLSMGSKNRSIAKLFNISEYTVCDIKREKVWSKIKIS